jgi:hypothetical protein
MLFLQEHGLARDALDNPGRGVAPERCAARFAVIAGAHDAACEGR